jgi:outer membrane immunogenic protein
MRSFLAALGLIALGSGALAADADYDIPVLRGSSPYVAAPPTYTRWSGFYAGGQGGYALSSMELAAMPPFNPTNPFITPLGATSGWAQFGPAHPKSANYGAFFGYTSQWDDTIIGVELNYNRTRLVGSSFDAKAFSAVALPAGSPNTYNGTTLATAAMKITDYGTFRLRAGWAYDSILPYAMIGMALGRAETSRGVTVMGSPAVGSPGGVPFVLSEGITSSLALWGYSAGVGVDILLSPNVFLRTEYEFVQFTNGSAMRANFNTVRGGLGYTF